MRKKSPQLTEDKRFRRGLLTTFATAEDYGCTLCMMTTTILIIIITRQHWIQRITFAAETNAADTYTP